MHRSVERHKDEKGRWWVTENGARKCHFDTRSEARLYVSGGTDIPVPPASTSRNALVKLYETYGVEKVRALHNRLEPLDVRILTLHLKGATQGEISRHAGISQPSVSYRLQQLVKRLQFLLAFPTLDPRQMREDLTPHFDDPMDVAILLMFIETTSQSVVAYRLGVTQGLVRHRIYRSLKTLRSDPKLGVYLQALELVLKNLNILHPILHPQSLKRLGERKPPTLG